MHLFTISSQIDGDEAWQILENEGCELLYSEEEEDMLKIIGFLPKGHTPLSFLNSHPFLSSVEATVLPTIDWDSQWELHSHPSHGVEYKNGYLTIKLAEERKESPYANHFRLKPGPGFGDLSHPTTRLVLKLMQAFVKNKQVLDIGTGSGILTFAAHLMGAKSVIGLDIDQEAVFHAQQNSLLNGFDHGIKFLTPDKYSYIDFSSWVGMMNMIQIEQAQAWESLLAYQFTCELMLTSGILVEGREDYLKMCQKWGWHLLFEEEEEGWLGFVFEVAKKASS